MHDLAGRRVLVTGAAGFIGANLVRALLVRGAHVVGLVRPTTVTWRLDDVEDEIELVVADVREPGEIDRAVADAKADLAVHLAFGGGHPRTAAERLGQLHLSVLGTAHVVEALARHGCGGAVHVGSSLEYGPRREPMREDMVLAPTVPRGASKAASTLVCLTWSGTVGLRSVVLRPFSVYGPWEDESRLVPAALLAALDGTELPLTEAGATHDFLYVGDLATAVTAALVSVETIAGAVVNVGSGIQTTNEELMATVGRVVGRDVPVRVGAYTLRAHDTPTWVADVQLARRLLDWQPATPLEEGVQRTLAWLEEHGRVIHT